MRDSCNTITKYAVDPQEEGAKEVFADAGCRNELSGVVDNILIPTEILAKPPSTTAVIFNTTAQSLIETAEQFGVDDETVASFAVLSEQGAEAIKRGEAAIELQSTRGLGCTGCLAQNICPIASRLRDSH